MPSYQVQVNLFFVLQFKSSTRTCVPALTLSPAQPTSPEPLTLEIGLVRYQVRQVHGRRTTKGLIFEEKLIIALTAGTCDLSAQHRNEVEGESWVM